MVLAQTACAFRCSYHFPWSYYMLFSSYVTAILIIFISILLGNKTTYVNRTMALIIPSHRMTGKHHGLNLSSKHDKT